jgi:hypothetical protein
VADADVQGERAGTRTDDWARSAGLEKAVLIGEGAKASARGSASAAATTAFFMSILHGCTRRVRLRRLEVGKSVLGPRSRTAAAQTPHSTTRCTIACAASYFVPFSSTLHAAPHGAAGIRSTFLHVWDWADLDERETSGRVQRIDASECVVECSTTWTFGSTVHFRLAKVLHFRSTPGRWVIRKAHLRRAVDCIL